MQEARQKTVAVQANKDDFATFYELLLPPGWDQKKVTEHKVDSLLALIATITRSM